MTHMLMSLANGKVSVCLEVGHSQPFCLAYTKVPVGWLQFPIYLQISTCSHQNSYGRATGSSPFNITVGACSSYSETCHHDPVSLLAMHVSEGTTRIRSLDWQASWLVNNPKWLNLDENWSVFFLDIIRNYQSKQLYENYKLTSLYIYRTAISKSFENQVLAR